MKATGKTCGGNDGCGKPKRQGFPQPWKSLRDSHIPTARLLLYIFPKPIPKGVFLTACTFSLQAHSSIRKDYGFLSVVKRGERAALRSEPDRWQYGRDSTAPCRDHARVSSGRAAERRRCSETGAQAPGRIGIERSRGAATRIPTHALSPRTISLSPL